MDIQLADVRQARNDLNKAIAYLQVISHTIPHNEEMNRHIAKLSAVQVKIGALETRIEYGTGD